MKFNWVFSNRVQNFLFMLNAYRDFLFQDIYKFAALVEDCVDDPTTFLELGIEENESLVRSLVKPQKFSFLHQYIFVMIQVWQSRDYRKNPDSYEDTEPSRLRLVFEEYGIPLTPYPLDDNEVSEALDDTRDEDEDGAEVDTGQIFYDWFLENEASFLWYWTQIADEVFHIVFANRRFLQRFGSALAEYLEAELPVDSVSRTILGSKIKRPGRCPGWLKTAVFHRDHGRCVFCMRDLSALIATDRRLHLDHIVPLNRGGTNDPSNFQLLCEACNLQKSDGPARAGRLYIPWWDY